MQRPPATAVRHRVEPAAGRRSAYRPDVDGLRAVAVVLVVAFHAGIGLVPGGYVGVDVFYVVSGFLITGLLVDELRARGSVSLPGFYARRVRRLLPMATLVLVVTAVVAHLVVAPLDQPAFGADVRSAALWFANWHFAAESTQYMADTAQGPVLHYWSLSVEEQFYVVWPLLLLAVAGRGIAHRSWSVARRRLLLVLAVLGAGSLACSVLLTPTTGPWAYFGTHTRAWELAAGALLALAVPALGRLTRTAALALSAGGLLLVVGSALLLDRSTPFPGTAALWPVAGTVLLLAGGARIGTQGVSGLLGRSGPAYVGRISYGWYLWHWPCLVLAGLLTAGPPTDAEAGAEATTQGRSWFVVLLAVIGSFVLAAVSHAVLEDPVRRSRWLAVRPRTSVLLGAGLALTSVLCATVALPAVSQTDVLQRSGPGVVAAGGASPTPPDEPRGSTARAGGGSASPTPVRTIAPATHLTETPAQARVDYDLADSCFLPFESTTVSDSCRFGDPHGTKVVALIGDSHALNWFVPMKRLARQRHWQLWFFAKAACSVEEVRVFLGADGGDYRECYSWREGVLAKLTALPRLDLVVIGRSKGYLNDLVLDSDGRPARGSKQVSRIWEAGARRTLAKLTAASRRVVIMRDTPWADSDVPACLSEHLQDFGTCDFPHTQTHLDQVLHDAETRAARGMPDVHRIDLTDEICPSDPCRAVWTDGTVVFRDRHHLTASFAATLTAPLGAALAPLL